MNDIEKICHIELLSVSDELETKNGYYVPHDDFPKLMRSCKKGLNLAYGIKSDNKVFIFSLVGYTRLMSCVISRIDQDLTWELKDD